MTWGVRSQVKKVSRLYSRRSSNMESRDVYGMSLRSIRCIAGAQVPVILIRSLIHSSQLWIYNFIQSKLIQMIIQDVAVARI